MGYYCNICKEPITKDVFSYSMDHFGRPLCMSHQKSGKKLEITTSSKITPQARKLSFALKKRGIKNKLEAYDGYKHVDISISWGRLNIEIDGKHHLLNPRQLYADLERDSFSKEDEKDTIRITNDMVDKDLDKLADSIAKVARKRHQEDSDSFW